MIEGFDALAARTIIFLAQNLIGLRGADFGKASPVGLFIIVALFIVILALGWDLLRHAKHLAARRKFAEAHGMDPSDSEAVDKAMVVAE